MLRPPERPERGGPCGLLKLTQMGTQGVLSLVDLLGLSCQYNRFCTFLAALVGPVQNFLFLTVHYFNYVSPSPSKQGRPSCWITCLLICVSGGPCQYVRVAGEIFPSILVPFIYKICWAMYIQCIIYYVFCNITVKFIFLLFI